jgi:hypothetical protein
MIPVRNPCLEDRTLDLVGVLPRRNLGRPLVPFSVWIARQALPTTLDTPALSRIAWDAGLRLWSLLEPWLEQGVRVRRYRKWRIVTVFGSLQYQLPSDGRWIHGAARGLAGGRLSSGNVPIEAPLQAWGVAHVLLGDNSRRWEATIESQVNAETETPVSRVFDLVKVISDWSIRCADRYLRKHVDVTALWRRVLAELALDPEVLCMARRIHACRRNRQSGGVSTATYDSFYGLLPELLEVERLVPSLTPLAYATRHQWSKRKMAPLKYLKEEFSKRRLVTEDWRRLRTTSPRPVWTHWNTHKLRGPARLLDFMAEWARVHRGLPLTTRMPEPMWDVLARTSVEPGEDRLLSPVAWPCRPAVLRGALDAWGAAQAKAAKQAFVEGDWARVVRWTAHYGGSVPVARKSTWSSALAAAGEDERRRRAQADAATTRWRSPIEAFTWGGYRVVPLTDPVALVEEAITLRHCADTFKSSCIRGFAHIFGLRDRLTGARIATLALTVKGRSVGIEDVRRMANRPPTEGDDAVADVVLNVVRDALTRRPPPDDEPRGGQQHAKRSVDELLAAITGMPNLPMVRDDSAE